MNTRNHSWNATIQGSSRRRRGRPAVVCLSVLIFVMVWFLLAGCSPTQQASGGGSGSEIVGVAQYPDSTTGGAKRRVFPVPFPVVGAPVFVFPKTSVPDTGWFGRPPSPKVVTDEDGSFRVLDIPRGELYLEISDGSGKSRVRKVENFVDSQVIDIGVVDLRESGGANLTINSMLPSTPVYYIGVKGTRFILRRSNADLDLSFDRLPSGEPLTLNIRVVSPVQFSTDLQPFRLSPNEVLTMPRVEITESGIEIR